MHSKYLKCDGCGTVIDRRAPDDFGGGYRKTESRGTFAPGEWPELLSYAKSLGWSIDDDKHRCPSCSTA